MNCSNSTLEPNSRCFVRYDERDESIKWSQCLHSRALESHSGIHYICDLEAIGVCEPVEDGSGEGVCLEFVQTSSHDEEAGDHVCLLRLHSDHLQVVVEWLRGLLLLGNISKLSRGIDPVY